MGASECYRVNAGGIIHQTIDGEAVIINLDRGIYYSLDSVGADVWAALEGGASGADVLARVTERYEGAAADMEQAVGNLLDEMRTEALIVEGAPGPGSGKPSTPLPAAGERRPFRAPVLRKYTDLQDLLLVDPIHQVDESGWPEQRPGEPRATTP